MKVLTEYPTKNGLGYILKNCAENGRLAGKYITNKGLEELKKDKDFDTVAEYLLNNEKIELESKLARQKERIDAANKSEKLRGGKGKGGKAKDTDKI